jgi:hypothetical protein
VEDKIYKKRREGEYKEQVNLSWVIKSTRKDEEREWEKRKRKIERKGFEMNEARK